MLDVIITGITRIRKGEVRLKRFIISPFERLFYGIVIAIVFETFFAIAEPVLVLDIYIKTIFQITIFLYFAKPVVINTHYLSNNKIPPPSVMKDFKQMDGKNYFEMVKMAIMKIQDFKNLVSINNKKEDKDGKEI